MHISRRNFLMAAGMVGATAKVFSQESMGAQASQPQANQPPDYHWGDPYEYLPQARAADHKAPDTPEATNGPWKNLRAVQQKRVIDIGSHSGEHRKEGSNYRERVSDIRCAQGVSSSVRDRMGIDHDFVVSGQQFGVRELYQRALVADLNVDRRQRIAWIRDWDQLNIGWR